MPRNRRLAITGIMVAGLLFLQAAWILVMPPFGGVDEFDHAYRASAAAHGEIFTSLGRPADGRGLLVTVNDGIAEAARPQCEVLEYPGRDNCRPVSDAGDGMVTIASAAAIYQPTYYLAVGWVTHFVDGYAALYAMRLVSVLLCTSLWAVTVWVITGWSRSIWPLVAAIGVLTPTVLYSLSIVAPNGLEMALGLALWSCLIGSARATEPRHRQRLLTLAVPLACVLAWVRPLSPIWLFFILLGWVVLLGGRGARGMLREQRSLLGTAALLVAVSAVTSTYWVLTHSTGEPAEVYDMSGTRLGETLDQIPLWFLQVISGVPFRNTPATFDVYVAGLVLFAFLLLPLVVCRTPRVRTAALVTVGSALGVALWYTYSRLPTAGPLWQGRYAWCLALGVVLLAGVALEDRQFRTMKIVGLIFGVPSLVIMHLRCLHFVLRAETGESPLLDGEWVSAPTWVLAVVALTGLAAWFVGVRMAMRAEGASARHAVQVNSEPSPLPPESPAWGPRS